MRYFGKHIMAFVATLTLLFSLAVLCHGAGGKQDIAVNSDPSFTILKTDPVGFPPAMSFESGTQAGHLFYVKKRGPARIAALAGFSTISQLPVNAFTPAVRGFIPQVSILKRIGVRRI